MFENDDKIDFDEDFFNVSFDAEFEAIASTQFERRKNALHSTTNQNISHNLDNQFKKPGKSSLKKAKRKFPGPAGVLSYTGLEVSHLEEDEDLECDSNEDTTIDCSQENSFFNGEPWMEMRKTFQDLPLDNFHIDWIKTTASAKVFRVRKVPFLAAVITFFQFSNKKDSGAVTTLKDTTGEIQAYIQCEVFKEHVSDFVIGSVLVIKDFAVLTPPNGVNHYLTITANNLVAIFSNKKQQKSSQSTQSTEILSGVKVTQVQDVNIDLNNEYKNLSRFYELSNKTVNNEQKKFGDFTSTDCASGKVDNEIKNAKIIPDSNVINRSNKYSTNVPSKNKANFQKLDDPVKFSGRKVSMEQTKASACLGYSNNSVPNNGLKETKINTVIKNVSNNSSSLLKQNQEITKPQNYSRFQNPTKNTFDMANKCSTNTIDGIINRNKRKNDDDPAILPLNKNFNFQTKKPVIDCSLNKLTGNQIKSCSIFETETDLDSILNDELLDLSPTSSHQNNTAADLRRKLQPNLNQAQKNASTSKLYSSKGPVAHSSKAAVNLNNNSAEKQAEDKPVTDKGKAIKSRLDNFKFFAKGESNLKEICEKIVDVKSCANLSLKNDDEVLLSQPSKGSQISFTSSNKEESRLLQDAFEGIDDVDSLFEDF